MQEPNFLQDTDDVSYEKMDLSVKIDFFTRSPPRVHRPRPMEVNRDVIGIAVLDRFSVDECVFRRCQELRGDSSLFILPWNSTIC